jgi:hypothetical protein
MSKPKSVQGCDQATARRDTATIRGTTTKCTERVGSRWLEKQKQKQRKQRRTEAQWSKFGRDEIEKIPEQKSVHATQSVNPAREKNKTKYRTKVRSVGAHRNCARDHVDKRH